MSLKYLTVSKFLAQLFSVSSVIGRNIQPAHCDGWAVYTEGDFSQKSWVSGLRPSCGILKKLRTHRFGNLISFRPHVRGETPTQLRLALSKGPNSVGVSLLTWGREQIQFPKCCVFWFLEYRVMDKVQKLSNSKYYTPFSGLFRIYEMSDVCTTRLHSHFWVSFLLWSSNIWTPKYILMVAVSFNWWWSEKK
jgi:hypothetical protein